MKILPYKAGSNSAKALAESLNARRINVRNTTPRRRISGPVVNWGNNGTEFDVSTTLPNVSSVLNPCDAVAAATNKLNCFQLLKEAGVRVPEFTTDRSLAASWLEESDHPIICRTLLRANSGNGIVVANTAEEIVSSPLYTRYIPKQQEYRVHVFRNTVFDIQRKARTRDVPDDQVNWKIRNLEGGFIFAREGVTPSTVPSDVLTQAKAAVRAVPGLDFGAVDVIWNEHRGRAYILEINTAPGLEGTTLEKYTNMVRVWTGEDIPGFDLEGQDQVETPETDEPVSVSTGQSSPRNTEEPDPIPEPSRIEVGSSVVIHPRSEYYGRTSPMNPSHTVGVVVREVSDPMTSLDIHVIWSNDFRNVYNRSDLLLADSPEGQIELSQGSVVQEEQGSQETQETQEVPEYWRDKRYKSLNSPPAETAGRRSEDRTASDTVYAIQFSQVILKERGLFRSEEDAQQVIDTDFVLSNAPSVCVTPLTIQ